MAGITVTVGAYLANARKAARLPLRVVAAHIGVSTPFLCDVERDNRRLVSARWAAICEILPGVTIRDLAAASIAAGPVTIDASALTRAQRAALTDAIVQAVERAA